MLGGDSLVGARNSIKADLSPTKDEAVVRPSDIPNSRNVRQQEKTLYSTNLPLYSTASPMIVLPVWEKSWLQTI